MSKKYENVLKKGNERIKKPKEIQDFIVNLSFDMKLVANFINGLNAKNIQEMNAQKLQMKINRAKMGVYQAAFNMRQIVQIANERKWFGENFDFDEVKPEPLIMEKKKDDRKISSKTE